MMSILLINIFIIILSLIKNRNKFIRNLNTTTLKVFIILIISRILFNFEFKNAIKVNSAVIFPKIVDLLRMSIYSNSKLTISLFLLFIWIIGSCIVFSKAIIKYYNFKLYLKKIPKINHIKDFELLEKIKQDLNINKNIKIYQSDEIITPIVVGINKFSIYLPNMILSREELSNILIHEVNHIKSKDNFKKIILLLFKILFWWNPFIYLLNKDIDHILEIQCDARTVSVMTDEQRIKYLEGILAIIKNAKDKDKDNILINNLQVSALYNKNDNKLKQRFNLILYNDNNNSKYKKYNLIFCILLISIFISSYIYTFKPIYYPDEDDLYMKEGEESFIYERDGYILKTKKYEE